jgi:hypothetical protein
MAEGFAKTLSHSAKKGEWLGVRGLYNTNRQPNRELSALI